MKLLPILFFAFYMVSCGDNSGSTSATGSADQLWISQKVAEMKKAFDAAANDIAKEELKKKYSIEIVNYIKSRNYRLDSIDVQVDNVEPLSETVYLSAFSNKDAEFRFRSEFKEPPTDRDSLYSYLKSLKKWSEVKSNFFVLDVTVNDASNQYMKAISFEAIPASLNIKARASK